MLCHEKINNVFRCLISRFLDPATPTPAPTPTPTPNAPTPVVASSSDEEKQEVTTTNTLQANVKTDRTRKVI